MWNREKIYNVYIDKTKEDHIITQETLFPLGRTAPSSMPLTCIIRLGRKASSIISARKASKIKYSFPRGLEKNSLVYGINFLLSKIVKVVFSRPLG